MYTDCILRELRFTSSILFLLWTLPSSSSAQLTQEGSISSTLATVTSSADASPPGSSTTFKEEPASITNTSSPLFPSATSSVTSASALPPTTASPAASTSEADPGYESTSSLFNYYFVFIAIFLCFVALGVFYLHRRSKLRKEQFRNSVQSALARDLDGWVNTRRWVHGSWRPGESRASNREEGLNEHGEAPPPYAAAVETGQGVNGGGVVSREGHYAGFGGAGTISLPVALRTFSRDGRVVAEPPEYHEATRHPHPTVAIGPSTAGPSAGSSPGGFPSHTQSPNEPGP